MKILKSKDMQTTSADDFLYFQIQNLLTQIKITQGGTDLAYTLRNHPILKNYCIAKQIEKIEYIESKYFEENGALKTEAINAYNHKISLQN